MTKSQLIKNVMLYNDCLKNIGEAKQAVDIFFNEIKQALHKGNRVELRDFAIFDVKETPAFVGRNPKTGESVKVPSKKKSIFKIS